MTSESRLGRSVIAWSVVFGGRVIGESRMGKSVITWLPKDVKTNKVEIHLQGFPHSEFMSQKFEQTEEVRAGMANGIIGSAGANRLGWRARGR